MSVARSAASLAAVMALLVAALASVAPAPAAQESADLRRIFPREADVLVERAGLARLDLPAEILSGCRQDLSDLRLFDLEGKLLPFLIDARRPEDGSLRLQRAVDAKLEAVKREEVRRESGPPLRREIYEMRVPATAPAGQAWEVAALVARPAFVARLSVVGIGEAGAETPIVTDGALFRLAGPRPAEVTRFQVAASSLARLRVTLESEERAYLEPAFRFESSRPIAAAGRLDVALEAASSRSRDGVTLIEVPRPRGIVPDALRLETSTPTFDRLVTVRDDGPGVRGDVGSSRLFRVAALARVEQLEVPLREVRGDRLLVEIDDGDSPALVEPRLVAVVRQPVIVFPAPAANASDAPAAILRFGGGRARPARFDLTGLAVRPGVAVEGKRAEAAAAVHDLSALPQARLGPLRSNAAYDGAPALAFAMRPAAPVDARSYARVRTLEIPEAPEGLSRLRLAPDDLAALRDDLGDLRVAGAEGRQWPYLLQRDVDTALVDLAVDGPQTRGGVSRYRLTPQIAPLRADRLLLDSEAPFFDRAFRATVAVAGQREALRLAGRIARPAGDMRLVAIEVAQTGRAPRLESIDLEVEDGDDAPLRFTSAGARCAVADLYLTAPAGRYTLLLGAPSETAPEYELARMQDVVLAVGASPVRAGSLEPNPAYSAMAGLARGEGMQRTLFWTAMVAAILVLGGLTLRLARRPAS